MKEKLKNATFSLPEKSLKELKNIVETGRVKSVNFAVREAIELYTAKIEKENLKIEMKAAAHDPLFLRDLNEVMNSFKTSDKQTSELITDW
ncbi:MAG: hypothetical protein FJW61_05735 [Actinobacteria bacterium]|nr:hypothetical protein [Actinomycetota bacterium]MBM3709904.1 hypothetical protein [Actinomycetota bacterium]MBM3713839.1 hypothetical protein [Actinomycetota bacterium]